MIFNKPAGYSAVVKDVAIDAESLRFNSQAGQIGHTVIANGSPPLRRFFGAALSRRLAARAATRYHTSVLQRV